MLTSLFHTIIYGNEILEILIYIHDLNELFVENYLFRKWFSIYELNIISK